MSVFSVTPTPRQINFPSDEEGYRTVANATGCSPLLEKTIMKGRISNGPAWCEKVSRRRKPNAEQITELGDEMKINEAFFLFTTEEVSKLRQIWCNLQFRLDFRTQMGWPPNGRNTVVRKTERKNFSIFSWIDSLAPGPFWKGVTNRGEGQRIETSKKVLWHLPTPTNDFPHFPRANNF